MHAESVGEILPQGVGGAAEATPYRNRSGHVGLGKPRPKLHDDETCVYGYDPETKFQFYRWKHLSSPKLQKSTSNVKVMLIRFFNSRRNVHPEYAPHGQTINKEYELEVLRRLRKRADMRVAKNWRFHHNTPAHSAHIIQDFLVKNNIPLTLPTWYRVTSGSSPI